MCQINVAPNQSLGMLKIVFVGTEHGLSPVGT